MRDPDEHVSMTNEEADQLLLDFFAYILESNQRTMPPLPVVGLAMSNFVDLLIRFCAAETVEERRYFLSENRRVFSTTTEHFKRLVISQYGASIGTLFGRSRYAAAHKPQYDSSDKRVDAYRNFSLERKLALLAKSLENDPS